ncbi:cupin-like domain-containing protein [Aquimarina sp. ERC-38]|uniref:cupin-like domain-containing protein n=1 Tax=Aquimarina sp. ERC-38 TaxID=2949996 RepID=UPI0022484872|nr:cupin-like domain-containing protein [Aquimarina sp. ERC-38]UZO81633.1 cupin-like domain-containing protein [Aquimarina sp. ERC-38]
MNTLHLEEIPRIAAISRADFIKQFAKPQKPVVIQKLTEDWPAYQKWNLNYIDKIAGGIEVPLFDDRPISSKYKFNEPHMRMKMSAYIDLLKTQPTNYRIFLYNLLKEIPVLRDDIKFPDLGFRYLRGIPFLFFGGENSKVFMHYDIDYANILHFHFDGEKKCILYPPSESKFLYKLPCALISHQEIDFNNPDFTRWPALQKAKGYITHLKHGEMLYMPEGYWHQMTYLTPGFSLSIRSMTRRPKHIVRGSYNFFIMRYIDNAMRNLFKEKWMSYKNKKAIKRSNKLV